MTDIWKAVAKGNFAKVKSILARKPELVYTKNEEGLTPLHVAAIKGYKDVVEILIAKGANVDAKVDKDSSPRKGVTPLHLAAGAGHTKMVEILLTHGADVNAETYDTPVHPYDKALLKLHLSVRGGDPNAEINKYSSRSIVRCLAGLQGRNVLKGHKEMANILLGNRTGMNHETYDTSVPLVNEFLSQDLQSAKSGELNTKSDEDTISPKGLVPLHLAAIRGHKDVVELLLVTGAKVGAKDGTRATALHMAASLGHKDLIDVLIAKGADLEAKDSYRHTPLQKAAIEGHKDVIDVLIAKGLKLNSKDEFGRTLLHLMATSDRTQMVEFLLARGADIHAKDNKGETPLHGAARAGHKKVVEFLIAKGAQVNVRSKYGFTPLYLAADHKDVVDLLRKHGAVK